jgi:hypothetical protein
MYAQAAVQASRIRKKFQSYVKPNFVNDYQPCIA